MPVTRSQARTQPSSADGEPERSRKKITKAKAKPLTTKSKDVSQSSTKSNQPLPPSAKVKGYPTNTITTTSSKGVLGSLAKLPFSSSAPGTPQSKAKPTTSKRVETVTKPVAAALLTKGSSDDLAFKAPLPQQPLAQQPQPSTSKAAAQVQAPPTSEPQPSTSKAVPVVGSRLRPARGGRGAVPKKGEAEHLRRFLIGCDEQSATTAAFARFTDMTRRHNLEMEALLASTLASDEDDEVPGFENSPMMLAAAKSMRKNAKGKAPTFKIGTPNKHTPFRAAVLKNMKDPKGSGSRVTRSKLKKIPAMKRLRSPDTDSDSPARLKQSIPSKFNFAKAVAKVPKKKLKEQVVTIETPPPQLTPNSLETVVEPPSAVGFTPSPPVLPPQPAKPVDKENKAVQPGSSISKPITQPPQPSADATFVIEEPNRRDGATVPTIMAEEIGMDTEEVWEPVPHVAVAGQSSAKSDSKVVGTVTVKPGPSSVKSNPDYTTPPVVSKNLPNTEKFNADIMSTVSKPGPACSKLNPNTMATVTVSKPGPASSKFANVTATVSKPGPSSAKLNVTNTVSKPGPNSSNSMVDTTDMTVKPGILSSIMKANVLNLSGLVLEDEDEDEEADDVPIPNKFRLGGHKDSVSDAKLMPPPSPAQTMVSFPAQPEIETTDNYEITVLADYDEDALEHRVDKVVPDWAQDQEQIDFLLYRYSSKFMDDIMDERIFPRGTHYAKFYPGPVGGHSSSGGPPKYSKPPPHHPPKPFKN